MIIDETRHVERKKSCKNCGAELTYKPGTSVISCGYCQHTETIITNTGFVELELLPYLQRMGKQAHSEDISMLLCKSCGATQHIEEHYKSLHCVYCSSPLILEDTFTESWILPGAVLPFQITQDASHAIFKKWIKGLWFAPNKLHRAALDQQVTKGLYLPYWTFDAQLKADYTGERGEYYYVTRTTKDANGKTRTHQERRTRWYPVSGRVSGFVDDTLIAASYQRQGKIPQKIAHWNLKKLQPFNSDFLAGYVTEKYTLSLEKGHLNATEEAHNIANRWARQDIGGDTQRVHHLDMDLKDETFKHILLPVYISAFRYNNKTYQFFVNGETGAISGSRPYSFWKIFFLVISILTVIFIIVLLNK